MPQALPHGALASGRVKEFARAKINLTLNVHGRRPDGYHELVSLVAFADVGDRLTLDLSAPPGVKVTGRFAADLAGRNIAEAALERIASAAPQLALGLVTLEKRLPVASGIGGGSADAAAVLRLVQHANPDHASAVDWNEIAAALGADVPVCLINRATWMSGIGEVTEPLERPLPSLGVVLANTLKPVPSNKTATVFANYRSQARTEKTPARPASFATANDVVSFLTLHGNDLEPAARTALPGIEHGLDALRTAPGCRYAAMSGAGPTCFGIFDNPEAAAETLRVNHPTWWVEPARLS